MSEKVQEYLFSFWEVIDELLNSVLFLLIGLEVLVLAVDPAMSGSCWWRSRSCCWRGWISVAVPISALSIRQSFSRARSRSSPGAACAAASRWRWRCRCRTATPSR